MLSEVVVCSVGNAPELTPAEREEILEVCSCLRIEAELLGRVVSQAEILLFESESEEEVLAVASPVIEPLECCRQADAGMPGRASY